LSYANIVHSNSPSGYGVIYINGAGPRKIFYCIFQNNQDYLFCAKDGSFEVSHSFISHAGSFSRSIAASTTKNSFTYRIAYQIHFFISLQCHAEIPLPQRSLEETLRTTYERTIDQTMEETLKETILESNPKCMCTNQMVNMRVVRVMFIFMYPMIFLMIS